MSTDELLPRYTAVVDEQPDPETILEAFAAALPAATDQLIEGEIAPSYEGDSTSLAFSLVSEHMPGFRYHLLTVSYRSVPYRGIRISVPLADRTISVKHTSELQAALRQAFSDVKTASLMASLMNECRKAKARAEREPG